MVRAWTLLCLAGCAAGGDDSTTADYVWWEDGGGEVAPDTGADADAPPGEDGAPPDGPRPDDGWTPPDADGSDEATPSEPVCRYECGTDAACVTAYGAGYVCREASTTVRRLCMMLCGGDADCRSGGASDPLMVCREGVCTMRACTGDGECGWAGTGYGCLRVERGAIRSCQRLCATTADCGYGVPSDILYRCEGGLCAWYCNTDTDCSTAFGTTAYGCRTPPSVEPGPSCLRRCSSSADCTYGIPSDVLAVCR